MLTMARSLGTNPKLLLIDEPTEGLMPAFVETIGRTITEIQRQGVAVLLVEQNTRLALEATQRVYVIEKGMIKHEARSRDLAGDAEARHRYLGVSVTSPSPLEGERARGEGRGAYGRSSATEMRAPGATSGAADDPEDSTSVHA